MSKRTSNCFELRRPKLMHDKSVTLLLPVTDVSHEPSRAVHKFMSVRHAFPGHPCVSPGMAVAGSAFVPDYIVHSGESYGRRRQPIATIAQSFHERSVNSRGNHSRRRHEGRPACHPRIGDCRHIKCGCRVPLVTVAAPLETHRRRRPPMTPDATPSRPGRAGGGAAPDAACSRPA